jgi:hypothetical protein
VGVQVLTVRPRLPVNTTGVIRARKAGSTWRAIANHRDADGRVRQYERRCPTGTAAENALHIYLAETLNQLGHARPSMTQDRYMARRGIPLGSCSLGSGSSGSRRDEWFHQRLLR